MSKVKTVIFDLDGTLSLTDHRQYFLKQSPTNWKGFFGAAKNDEPNEPVVTIFKSLQEKGYRLEIWTGRSDEVKDDTIKWLHQHKIYPDIIKMRKARDHRGDVIIKKEWLDQFLFNNNIEDILCVFDDRDTVTKFWRSKGLTCLQVAEGNF